MPEVDDIIIDSATDDLVIENGDFRVKKSDQQHVEHILRADMGHFRQFPLIGVGIEKFVSGPFFPQKLKQEITLQLEADNYNVREVQIDAEGELSIDAKKNILMATHVVSVGQDIWDVAIQRFGQIDNIFDLLASNPTIDINSLISSADKLEFDDTDKGDLQTKTFIKNTNFVVMNADEDAFDVPKGDYNDDFNNDYHNT